MACSRLQRAGPIDFSNNKFFFTFGDFLLTILEALNTETKLISMLLKKCFYLIVKKQTQKKLFLKQFKFLKYIFRSQK